MGNTMKMNITAVAAACLVIAACTDSPAPETETVATGTITNVLLEDWDTPFGVPPFDRISSEDYLPALRAGMQDQAQKIDEIVGNSDAPTFANTIEALERSDDLLDRVNYAFSAVNSAHADDVMRETAKVFAPEEAAHYDNINLNPVLFERVNSVNEQSDELGLSGEQARLLEETLKRFVRAGANLDDESQSRLREINADLASLLQEFDENLLDETNNFELLVTDKADLGNLPASLVALAADEAKRRGHDCECWAFTLQRPSINPFLEYSPNREMRKAMFDGYAMRGDNDNDSDNKAVLARMVQLRAERAALMGYKNHAEFVLSDNMAETPENAYSLLNQIWDPAIRVAKQERADLQAMMQADGVDDRIRGWDWRHYTEKVRKAKYSLDADSLRPYFEVTAVRDGVFALSTKLFGLQFERRDDLPTWHPDQQVFEVKEADGTHLAILYMDFFARESKQGGAWMNALRSQSKLDGIVTPIITNNFNFPARMRNQPGQRGVLSRVSVRRNANFRCCELTTAGHHLRCSIGWR